MKEPTRGPLFACLYQGLCDKARTLGYALAIHGTLVNDMDLVAVPWVDTSAPAEDLAKALKEHIGACGYDELLRRDSPWLTEDHIKQLVAQEGMPTNKPHGRLSWNLYLWAGAKVDLSVMPRLPIQPSE